MKFGARKSFLTALLVLFIICLSLLIFTGAELYKVKGNSQGVFELENGAWIKNVREQDLVNGGDTSAIRFKFTTDYNFVSQNNVSNINAFATIDGKTLLNKTFNNVSELVADGSYTHYFDFANIPKSYFASNITLTVTANFNNGSKSVSLDRTMEYVAGVALSKDSSLSLYNYLGNEDTGRVFSNTDENVFNYGGQVEILLDGYDGTQIKSVYVNSFKQADCSLFAVQNNKLLLNTENLEVDKKYSIIAITSNGNCINIQSVTLKEAVADVTLDQTYLFRNSNDNIVTATLDKSYDIETIVLDGQTPLEYTVNDKILSFDGSQLSSGRHEFVMNLSNSSKITMPVYLFDSKHEINSLSTFADWLNACRLEKTAGTNYVYGYLSCNLDLSDTDGARFTSLNSNSCASGVFDGKGFTISGLSVPDGCMFDKTYDFVMQNVGFVNTSYEKTFLYPESNADSTLSLVNCYFNFTSNSTPFNKSSGIAHVENIIFNTHISYKSSTSLFKSGTPVLVKNMFVIGDRYSEKDGSYNTIKLLNDQTNATNCASYMSLSELTSAISQNKVSTAPFSGEYWDFSKTDHVWKTA